MSNDTSDAKPEAWHHPNKLWIYILAAGAIGAAGYIFIPKAYHSYVLSQFESSRREYIKLRPDEVEKPTGDFCRGQCITIDVSKQKIDPFYFKLPEDLRAMDPSTVKTLVFLRWKLNKVGEFEGGVPAIRYQCFVELVDFESKKLLRRDDFFGGHPPPFINRRYGSGDGTLPTEEIVAFIRASAKQ